MVLKFKDIKLALNKRLSDSLCKIYGIGIYRAKYICDLLGYGLYFNINYINRYFFECINIFYKKYFILNSRLKFMIKERLEFFWENKLIKGLRVFRGLPIHGQRTHSNHKTSYNLRPRLSRRLQIIWEKEQEEKKKKEKKRNKEKKRK